MLRTVISLLCLSEKLLVSAAANIGSRACSVSEEGVAEQVSCAREWHSVRPGGENPYRGPSLASLQDHHAQPRGIELHIE
jgi:hypothetical protein